MCTYCSKIVLTYLNSSDINSDLKSDLQALQDDLAKKFQLQSDESSSTVQELSSPQRKISVGYQEERLLSQPKYLLSNADRKNILQQSTSLKVLYEDVAKALPNQNPGSDIIHYLITKNKSSNKSQAIAILTAMIEAGYIIEIDTTGLNPPNPIKQRAFYFDENEEGNNSSTPSSDSDILHEFNENAFYKLLRPSEIMSNSGTFNLNLDVDNSSVHLSKPETAMSCKNPWFFTYSKEKFTEFSFCLSISKVSMVRVKIKTVSIQLKHASRTLKTRSFRRPAQRDYKRHFADMKTCC